jgi:transposase
MAPRLSKRESDALDEFLRDNLQVDSHEVAALYSVTHGIINKRKAVIRRIALTGIDNRSKGGRPKIIIPEILEYAIALIARDSTLYLDEVADYLFMEFGIQLDIPQVSRLWKQAGVSHKKLSVQARQRNEVLIAAWTFKMTTWDVRQLVFVDESAYNERTGDRRYGWGPSGHRARVKRWLKKSER